MPYPPRLVLELLPQFRDDVKVRNRPVEQRRFDVFVAAQYTAGRSLREIGELTGRTQTAVRRSLGRSGTPHPAPRTPHPAPRTPHPARGRGAQAVASGDEKIRTLREFTREGTVVHRV